METSIGDNKSKKRWTIVWTGLFTDPSGKHYYAVGNGIWVFLYILSRCNRAGYTELKIKTISRETGVPRGNVNRYLAQLRGDGYIKTVQDGRKLKIWVLKWKTLPKKGKGISEILKELRTETKIPANPNSQLLDPF